MLWYRPREVSPESPDAPFSRRDATVLSSAAAENVTESATALLA
jgi:hypothetical protein